jgi:hypothetical protein
LLELNAAAFNDATALVYQGIIFARN